MKETIEANDLRIGNLVNRYFEKKYDFGSSMEWQPIVFNLDDFKLLKCFKHKPIPLTEEWLLKFGFITKGIHYNFTLGNMEIASAIRVLSTNERGKFYLDGDIPEWMKIKLEYVHQLQNLYFVFAGEELEIKN